MMRQLFTTCCVAVLMAVLSVSAHAVPASNKPLEGAQVGVAYKLPGQDRTYGKNQDLYFHPASTQKIVTALAAML